MTRLTRGMMLVLALTGRNVLGQRPVEFKANVKMVDASDGSKSAGMMYFGGAKMRTELTKDGQNIVVLADPVAKSQLILMPDDKMYMQMPMGQGPVNVSISGPSDPTNPCSGGSGATDCVKGETETINGHRAMRWDYTSAEGVRTRAWVSPTLRFPVKTEDDNGGAMELSNIAVGPQPANLFTVPAGFTKMDFGGMGAAGATGRGRGRSGGNADPIAAAMAGLSPEMREAAAKAMRGAGPTTGAAPAGATGSAWEKAKGWILNVTVEGTSPPEQQGSNRKHAKYSAKYVASAPLNLVSPAAGVPGTPGPIWQHAPGVGDSPEVRAVPITLSVETEGRTDVDGSKEVCSIVGGPYTSQALMKGSARKSVPSTQMSGELLAQPTMLKMSADLKTFDLLASVGGMVGYEVTKTRINHGACPPGLASVENKTDSTKFDFGFIVDLKGAALPSSFGPIAGSKKMTVSDAQHRMIDATVTWTITPIR